MAMADDEYYLLAGEETRGPFGLGQLQEQWHAGQLPLDALFIRKGSPEARPVNEILERIIAYRPAEEPVAEVVKEVAPVGKAAVADTAGQPNYRLRIGLGLVVFVALGWLLNPARPKKPPEQVLHGRVEVSRVELRIENLNLFDWTNVVVRLEGNAPEAMAARVGRVGAGETVKVPLTNFGDGRGQRFEPWKAVVSEVWIGGDSYEFRKFPLEMK